MRSSSQICGRELLVRLAAVGLLSGAVAGCSADTTRFSADGGATGAYGAQPAPEVTGSLATGRVEASQLPPPGQPVAPYSQAAAPYGAPASYAAAGTPQPLYGSPAYNSAPAPSYGATPGQGTHMVAAGETLDSVARHYGVSAAQLGAANNIAPGMTVRTGQTLVIPPRSSSALASSHGTTARGTQTAALPPEKPAQMATAPKPAPAKEEQKTQASTKVASAAPTAAVQKSAAPAASTNKVDSVAKAAADDAEDAPRALGSGPQFRAPVRGRVIATFGPKPGGTHNDGVNFAVPEGTAVRAAEDGVVAYAGNELKGYGNLVLIKHADGYVTAYAHASELDVKKGDQVRRGQVIAKAGQTGSVTTPQLHFEIRKGTQAVDPGRYVAGL